MCCGELAVGVVNRISGLMSLHVMSCIVYMYVKLPFSNMVCLLTHSEVNRVMIWSLYGNMVYYVRLFFFPVGHGWWYFRLPLVILGFVSSNVSQCVSYGYLSQTVNMFD